MPQVSIKLLSLLDGSLFCHSVIQARRQKQYGQSTGTVPIMSMGVLISFRMMDLHQIVPMDIDMD